MDLAWTSFPAVNSLGCVKVLTNSYSVPLQPGTKVQAKVYARFVELWQEGRCVARHERCYRRHQQVLDLEHYLDVLSRGRVPSPDRVHSSNNAALVYGRTASIRSGSH